MDTYNIVKGTQDDIAEAVESSMPRQAIVTRVDGFGVWVRFTPVDNGAPESWYPSTVAGLGPGSSGWVHPLAGGKGRFIADNVMRPVTRSAFASPGRNGVSTAGDFTIPASPTTANSLIMFTGLVPGKTYRLSWNCMYSAWISGTTNARWSVRIVHGGGTVWNGWLPQRSFLEAEIGYQATASWLRCLPECHPSPELCHPDLTYCDGIPRKCEHEWHPVEQEQRQSAVKIERLAELDCLYRHRHSCYSPHP